MSNSTIRMAMRRAINIPASETLNEDGYEDNETVQTNVFQRVLPDTFDNVARNCYRDAAWLLDRITDQAEILANRYLEEGFKGRLFPYQFVVRFGREPYPDIAVTSNFYDLSRSDKRRLARYAELLVDRLMVSYDTSDLWEIARCL